MNTLLDIVEQAITSRLDMGTYHAVLEQEETLRAELGEMLGDG